MSTTEATVELHDLKKSYGNFHAVKGVSLSIRPGMVYGLLGPNGAGKTTTIRMVMDIVPPDSGEVRLFGRARQAEDSRRIGYLPEERGLYRKMSVVDHLIFLAELNGLTKRTAQPRIDRWLERLELADRAKKKIEELSKGMQQKIQLVGMLLHEPEIVILDEPFSGLDPINQTLFKDAFAELKREGKTLLFCTHVMEQAEKLCDEICLISAGRAVLQGNLREIRRTWGGNAYRLAGHGDLESLNGVPGVAKVVAKDGTARVFLDAGADPAAVLAGAVERVRVTEFVSEEAALEDIFVKVVGDDVQGESHAA
jgi:ABC-2 type transport system ATP-binding protein